MSDVKEVGLGYGFGLCLVPLGAFQSNRIRIQSIAGFCPRVSLSLPLSLSLFLCLCLCLNSLCAVGKTRFFGSIISRMRISVWPVRRRIAWA